MSEYQVLARKYRPKDFSQLVGQSHVWHALANAIDTGRLHHAYLFTGTRGVGKTTIARILAKCLNCETGITSQPCGVCDTCVSIDQGRFIDLIEIDAASRTKVEDTRDLLENVPYAPTQGRYKVYLIDEVHMLSTHSFNALLKTLEEPPEHVKFILATTDPQKLPITIVSRCLQFVLRPMSQVLLHEHLSKILTQENISFADNAIWQLASAAKGSVRDALSLTDQAIAFGGGRLDEMTVINMLGLVNTLDVLTLLQDIHQGNRDAVAAHIARLRMQMVDAVAVLDTLVDNIHELALLQFLPLEMDKNDEQKQAFSQLAQQIPAEVLQLYYEIAIKAREAVQLASTPMQALEMGILRLLAFRPLAVDELPSNQMICQPSNTTPEPTDNTVNEPSSQTAVLADKSLSDEPNLNNEPTELTESADTHQNDDQDEQNVHQDDCLQVGANDVCDDAREQTAQNHQTATPTEQAIAQDGLDGGDLLNQNMPSDNQPSQNQPNSHDLSSDEPNQAAIHHQYSNQEQPNQNEQLQDKSQQAKPVSVGTTDGQPMDSKSALQAKLLAPKVDLTGDWDAQKWDYWLSLARVDGVFDNDELALLGSSRMIGGIDGVSTLYVESNNAQVEVSFASARKKILQHFQQMTLSDEMGVLSDDDKQDIPYARKRVREQEVLIDAQNQLIQSPVVQQLWQQGFIINDGSQILSGTKLTLE